MKPEDRETMLKRELRTIKKLQGRFEYLGDWKFKSRKTGYVHDLSAADVELIDFIEDNGYFVVEAA